MHEGVDAVFHVIGEVSRVVPPLLELPVKPLHMTTSASLTSKAFMLPSSSLRFSILRRTPFCLVYSSESRPVSLARREVIAPVEALTIAPTISVLVGMLVVLFVQGRCLLH